MAVYTEVPDDELQAFLALYDIGDILSFKGIADGVENTNFMLETTGGRYILTLYEKRVETRDLPFFLALLEHLNENGISCPFPVKNKTGAALGTLCNRPAALVTFLDGLWVKRPKPEHCSAVGRALAELHLAGQTFAKTRKNALGLSAWRPLYETFATRAGDIQPGLGNLIEEELEDLEQAWPRGLPTGIIHADLFPDNVFFIGNSLSGLIDFYFACHDALAYDLAICLNAWCFEPDFAFNVTKGRAFLRGYQSVRKLETNEYDALPVLSRGAALRFLLTRAHDWLHISEAAYVTPHNPVDYIKRLKFHRTVSSPTEYGLEPAP